MTKTMRALVKYAPGAGNLELREIPVPQIGDDDVLMKVAYCGICGSDLHIEDGVHPFRPPVVIGHEYSGVVAEVGNNVKNLKPGDSVGFWRGFSSYPGVESDGGFAEYMRAPAVSLWKLPEGISFQEASQFETVMTPMYVVRDRAQVKEGDRIVISGPGPIGLWSTNIARLEGAGHITVLGGPRDEKLRLPKALELGADEAWVSNEETLARLTGDAAPQTWIDASGAAAALQAAVTHVRSRSRIVACALGKGPWNIDMTQVTLKNLTIVGSWGARNEWIAEGAELIRTGKLKVAPLLSVMPLTQWQAAFAMLRRQEAIKILLDPTC